MHKEGKRQATQKLIYNNNYYNQNHFQVFVVAIRGPRSKTPDNFIYSRWNHPLPQGWETPLKEKIGTNQKKG